MVQWVNKYYKPKIQYNNALLYFYHSYVKNLRYYFYEIQQKCNKKIMIPFKIVIKVPKEYLELPVE